MHLQGIPFESTDWSQVAPTEHPGETGVARWRTRQFGDVRVRIVKYSPGYRADHWCEKGHILLCLEGELHTELADGRNIVLRPGMSYQVADGLRLPPLRRPPRRQAVRRGLSRGAAERWTEKPRPIGVCKIHSAFSVLVGRNAPMGRHDRSYRQLFSHPGMVASLLRDLLGERRTGPLDLSSLERVNDSWVSASHAARYGDQIWRLCRPGGGEVYLLVEFQSNVQRFMAFRVLTYVALLYEDLIARKRWSSAGRIPEVIPVVVYNGNRRWSAPLAVEELIEPGAGSRRHLPRLSYLLVDGGRYPAPRLARTKGPVGALFLLERQRSPAQLDRGVRLLVDQLRGPEDAELRRAFLVWIQRVLLPDRGLTEEEIPALPDLQEFKAMLEQRVRQWNRQLIAQGRKEGRKEALAELLLRHLKLKFGPVDEKVRARIDAASPARLMTWAERVLTAETLPDVFRR